MEEPTPLANQAHRALHCANITIIVAPLALSVPLDVQHETLTQGLLQEEGSPDYCNFMQTLVPRERRRGEESNNKKGTDEHIYNIVCPICLYTYLYLVAQLQWYCVVFLFHSLQFWKHPFFPRWMRSSLSQPLNHANIMFSSLSKSDHLENKLADYIFRDKYRLDNTVSSGHIP